MKCPCCQGEDICHSGTKFMGRWYDFGCNKCGYVWNKKDRLTER